MAEEGQVQGVATVEDGEFGKIISVSMPGKTYVKKIYVGSQYDPERDGPLPNTGDEGTFVYWQSDPKPGRKYGSSYLNRFIAGAQVGATGGNQASPNGHSAPIVAAGGLDYGQLFVRALSTAILGQNLGVDPESVYEIAENIVLKAVETALLAESHARNIRK